MKECTEYRISIEYRIMIENRKIETRWEYLEIVIKWRSKLELEDKSMKLYVIEKLEWKGGIFGN